MCTHCNERLFSVERNTNCTIGRPLATLYTCRHIRGGGVVDSSTKWDESASVCVSKTCLVRYAVLPPPLASPFARSSPHSPHSPHSAAPDPLSPFRSLAYRAPPLARSRVPLYVCSHPYPQCPRFLSVGEKRTETRCRPCRPDCACFLAETRHNASSYRTPTMTNVPWRGHRPRWLFNHDARCNFTPRTVAAEALNHCGPLSIRCLPRMGRECSCTLSLKHVS